MIGILNQKWGKMKLAFLWLYNSFVFRLIWAILTFVVILLVLVFVIRIRSLSIEKDTETAKCH